MEFVPFQYRAWVKKLIWKDGQLVEGDPFDVVHDGDTCYLLIDKGERNYSNPPCRFYGIDTPELNDKDPEVRRRAIEARDFLRPLIRGKEVYIISVDKDPYDRPVVLVWLNPADFGDRAKSVNRLLVDKGYAVPRYQTHGAI